MILNALKYLKLFCLGSFSFFLFSNLSLAGKNPSFVMGAIGDSITTAVNSTGWGSKPKDSWSTGSNSSGPVESHYLKLKKIISEPVETHNVARGGATVANLEDQLEELLPHKPDYVSLLLGANDACNWDDDYSESLINYGNKMEEAILSLIQANESVKILMLPVPDLLAMREIGEARGCQFVWDMFGMCNRLLGSDRTDEDRRAFGQRIVKINNSLEDIASKYLDNVKYDKSLASFDITDDHVSTRDCFHPSGEGQNLISDLSWKSGWFADNF